MGLQHKIISYYKSLKSLLCQSADQTYGTFVGDIGIAEGASVGIFVRIDWGRLDGEFEGGSVGDTGINVGDWDGILVWTTKGRWRGLFVGKSKATGIIS